MALRTTRTITRRMLPWTGSTVREMSVDHHDGTVAATGSVSREKMGGRLSGAVEKRSPERFPDAGRRMTAGII